jgi:hypothetical protein
MNPRIVLLGLGVAIVAGTGLLSALAIVPVASGPALLSGSGAGVPSGWSLEGSLALAVIPVAMLAQWRAGGGVTSRAGLERPPVRPSTYFPL